MHTVFNFRYVFNYAVAISNKTFLFAPPRTHTGCLWNDHSVVCHTVNVLLTAL